MDEVSLGAEPRRHRRPSRVAVLITAGSATVVGATVALLVAQPWHHEQPTRLASTGVTCTVAYGSDLVVLAAEVTNPSTTTTVEITNVGLAASATDATPSGGPIDIVSATGCEHVLALRDDEVAPGDTMWLGITVRTSTCRSTTLPVVVGSRDRSGTASTSVGVPLDADTAPFCSGRG